MQYIQKIFRVSVPSQQKWTQESFKKRNESQYFVNLRKPTAFIPRFAWQRASAGMMNRRKNEVAQGQFAPAQAYHTGYSLSSNFRGINAKQVFVRNRRKPVACWLRSHRIVISFNVSKYISLCFSSGFVVFVVNKFTLKTAEKNFRLQRYNTAHPFLTYFV